MCQRSKVKPIVIKSHEKPKNHSTNQKGFNVFHI